MKEKDNNHNENKNPWDSLDDDEKDKREKLWKKYVKKYTYVGDVDFLPFHMVYPDYYVTINRTVNETVCSATFSNCFSIEQTEDELEKINHKARTLLREHRGYYLTCIKEEKMADIKKTLDANNEHHVMLLNSIINQDLCLKCGEGSNEQHIQCQQCGAGVHSECISLPKDTKKNKYDRIIWNCEKCKDSDEEEDDNDDSD